MLTKIIKNLNLTNLETPRLILRPIQEKDTQSIFQMRNKKFVFSMMRSNEELNYNSHVQWFRKRRNRIDYAIINKGNKKIIGVINTIFYVKKGIIYAELGKYIGYKIYHGKGLGLEASKEWINFIFTSTNIKYIFAQTLKENKSNIKLNKKLGFKILKNKNHISTRSKWRIMELTKNKWLKKNEEILRNIYFFDLKTILSWRNSLRIREISLDTTQITFKKHLKWYKKIQNNFSYSSYVLSFKNNLFGVVNLKKENSNLARWSIYKKPFSKRGIGTYLAYKILDKVFYETNLKNIDAHIFIDNNTSIRFHKTLGFKYNKKINNSVSSFLLKKSTWMQNREFISKKINTKYKINKK